MTYTKRKLLMIVFVLATTALSAQNTFEIHIGPSLPMGEFSSTGGPNSGGAAIGVNFGMQYSIPVSDNGLEIYTGVDINYNGLKKESKNFAEEFLRLFFTDVEVKHSQFFNIPISVGLSYGFQQSEKLFLRFAAGPAYNYLIITDAEITLDGEKTIAELDSRNKLGVRFGVSTRMNDKINLSVNYQTFGDHDFTTLTTSSDGTIEDTEGSVNVSFLTLTLGLFF